MIEPGQYKHYKGHIYEVLGLAKHSETLADLVIYKNIETGEMWARPVEMWDEMVEWEGREVKRFTKID